MEFRPYTAIVMAPLFGLIFFASVKVFWLPPLQTEYPKTVSVPQGSTVSQTAYTLSSARVISSEFLFKLWVSIISKNGVHAGTYYVGWPSNPLYLAYRMANGDPGVEPVKFLVVEGSSIEEIGILCEAKLLGCTKESFKKSAIGKEGYLFPDTYNVLPTISPKELVQMMESNFTSKLRDISSKVEGFNKPIGDVITMASIIEKEARTPETRRLVSSVLWKRIQIGMALQVDAVFVYSIGKDSSELRESDLSKDSPYNTYTRRGLPPTPIGNPGLDSIISAVEPTSSPYLYYLTGKDGKFYFAVTHEEHVRNKELYLR